MLESNWALFRKQIKTNLRADLHPTRSNFVNKMTANKNVNKESDHIVIFLQWVTNWTSPTKVAFGEAPDRVNVRRSCRTRVDSTPSYRPITRRLTHILLPHWSVLKLANTFLPWKTNHAQGSNVMFNAFTVAKKSAFVWARAPAIHQKLTAWALACRFATLQEVVEISSS